MNFEGKKIFITGGSSGIGKATAEKLIKEGAKVLICGRDEAKLNETAQNLGCDALQADVSKQSDVEKCFDHIAGKWGGLDVLINNAGIGRGGRLHELSLEDMKKVWEINVLGATHCGQKAAQIFREQKSGNIVNIGSSSSLKGYPGGSVYVASKFALRGLSECWKAELRPYNVRVFQINPSEVTTAFGQKDGKERPDQAKKLRSEEIAHAIYSVLAMDDRGFIPELNVWATNPWEDK